MSLLEQKMGLLPNDLKQEACDFFEKFITRKDIDRVTIDIAVNKFLDAKKYNETQEVLDKYALLITERAIEEGCPGKAIYILEDVETPGIKNKMVEQIVDKLLEFNNPDKAKEIFNENFSGTDEEKEKILQKISNKEEELEKINKE